MKMFWGLILEPGKKIEQKAEASFHLTMAALEPSNKTPTPNKPAITSVIAESNKTSYILCNLDQQRVLQQPLDHVFTEGESISFSVNGENKVHLTGYIMPDSDIEDSEDMYDFDASEDDSEADEMIAAMNDKKRKQVLDAKDANKKVKFGGDEPQAAAVKSDKKQEKAKGPAKAGKNDAQAKAIQKAKAAMGEDDDDDDEDDMESDDDEDMSDLLDQFEDDDDDDEEDDEDDMDDSSPEAKKPAKPQAKGQNNQKGTPAKIGQQAKPDKNQGNQNNQTPQKKPFQQGGGKQQWSQGKNKGPQNNFGKNQQNSGKKGTPQGGKFGGSPGNKNKKPWMKK